MADIEEGRIDCVVVYKVDRLSRSLLDFARMMETFEKHGISFVSVTQQFSTTNSMGRLTLNILLSFAQFEREIISERTRDKMAAARRKGKYVGGPPILGYDVDPRGPRLVVNEREAARVREIFRLYLEHESLLPVVHALEARGWTTKKWTTRKGRVSGGRAFTKSSLHGLLTNVTYLGKTKYKDEVHDGEHPAIVDAEDFERVQRVLRTNHRAGGPRVRDRYGALLKGLLRCGPCDCSMSHSRTSNGTKHYRYYVCCNAQKRGWAKCPSKSVPAGEIERFVVDRIRAIGRDPGLVAATLARVREKSEGRTTELQAERRRVSADAGRDERDAAEAAVGGDASRLADRRERIRLGEQRITEIDQELLELRRTTIDESDVARALAEFAPVWESLSPSERARVLHLLIERVDYDGAEGTVAVTFRPNGIRTLAAEVAA